MTSSKYIKYTEKFEDGNYFYRHVVLPEDLANMLPQTHLMTETEWRNIGIQMSIGWQHYMVQRPERHIVSFRRLKNENNNDN